MNEHLTIAYALAAGYTHLDVACPGCGWIVQVPLERGSNEAAVASLLRRMRCKRCRIKPARGMLWHQSMASGSGREPRDRPAQIVIDVIP